MPSSGGARRLRLKELNRRLKTTTPCADCGGLFHPVAMQWDHLPGLEKGAEISNLVKAGMTTRFHEELEKCELVCANCHAVRSYERRAGV